MVTILSHLRHGDSVVKNTWRNIFGRSSLLVGYLRELNRLVRLVESVSGELGGQLWLVGQDVLWWHKICLLRQVRRRFELIQVITRINFCVRCCFLRLIDRSVRIVTYLGRWKICLGWLAAIGDPSRGVVVVLEPGEVYPHSVGAGVSGSGLRSSIDFARLRFWHHMFCYWLLQIN